MLSKVIYGLFAGMMLCGTAQARPVSYQGAWTLLGESDRQSSALWGHYTINPKLSVGWRSEHDRERETVFHGVQGTYLFKRWFGENYQANLYGFGNLGLMQGTGTHALKATETGMAGVLADWETRRWFLSYKARFSTGSDIGSDAMQAARIGVAPYIGDMNDLHTWVMIEVDQRPKAEEPLGVTPLLRFFYGPTLVEVGYSLTDDEPMFNFAYRF